MRGISNHQAIRRLHEKYVKMCNNFIVFVESFIRRRIIYVDDEPKNYKTAGVCVC